MKTDRDTGEIASQRDKRQGTESAHPSSRPAFMYIHYMEGTQHRPSYPCYLFQISNGAIETQIKEAIDDIIARRVKPIKQSADIVDWRVYSYTVFVLHASGHELSSVNFVYQPDGGNHTFYDRKALQHNDCSVVYYVNRRKKYGSSGGLGDQDSEPFKWYANHSLIAAASPKSVLTHEGTGTNTGP